MHRAIVLRLIVTDQEGCWMWVTGEIAQAVVRDYDADGNPIARQMPIVPTGSVEWAGDQCAEVYVPADKLLEWQAEWVVKEKRGPTIGRREP